MTPRTATLRQGTAIALLLVAVLIAYYVLQQFSRGNELGIVLPAAGALCGLILLKPRIGLYAFCFTLVLIPYDWRIEGLKFTSANTLMVGAALVAWGTSVAIRRRGLQLSVVILPLLVVVVVAWFNYFRYGSGFFNLPYVLTEAVLLFILATQLIRTREQLEQLLLALALMTVVRNLMDLGVTIYSFQQGDVLGAIRQDRLLISGTSTTESEWRSLLLPLLAVGALFAKQRLVKLLLISAVFLDVAWLAFAATRIGFLGIGISAIAVLLVPPREQRANSMRLVIPGVIFVALLMTVYSQSWVHIFSKTQEDLFIGDISSGRWRIWEESLKGFWGNPWMGSVQGVKHSFLFHNAGSMGLVFMVPYVLAVFLIWRHLSYLRRQDGDNASGSVIGMQGCLLVVTVLSVVGYFLNSGINAFFFWTIAGAFEGYYLQRRKDRRTEVVSVAQRYFPQIRFRRRGRVSAGGVVP